MERILVGVGLRGLGILSMYSSLLIVMFYELCIGFVWNERGCLFVWKRDNSYHWKWGCEEGLEENIERIGNPCGGIVKRGNGMQ
jgi:hypothetical protein